MQDRIVETTETASEEPSGICMAAISHIGEQANDAVNSINFAAFHRCLVAERLARAAVAAARRVAAHNERGTRSNLAAARCPRSAKYREKHRPSPRCIESGGQRSVKSATALAARTVLEEAGEDGGERRHREP